jgi:hypothetical protein
MTVKPWLAAMASASARPETTRRDPDHATRRAHRRATDRVWLDRFTKIVQAGRP